VLDQIISGLNDFAARRIATAAVKENIGYLSQLRQSLIVGIIPVWEIILVTQLVRSMVLSSRPGKFLRISTENPSGTGF
jgi:hypothetical protein